MSRNLAIRVAGAVAGSAMIFVTAFQAEAAPRRYHRGGGNGGAVAALAFGAVALGIGAAIASSNRRDREYYAPSYGYAPQTYYEPQVQYAPPQQYYEPQVQYVPQQYYAAPVYHPGYGGGYGVRRHRSDGNRWQQIAREKRAYSSN